MSADDVKAAFPAILLNLVKRRKLAELLEGRKFKEAAALKAELDGPLPQGQIVSLGLARLRT